MVNEGVDNLLWMTMGQARWEILNNYIDPYYVMSNCKEIIVKYIWIMSMPSLDCTES